MYQPRKRTFVPCAHADKSFNRTKFDATGPDMVVNAPQKAVETGAEMHVPLLARTTSYPRASRPDS
jgi:hypothetical protein